MIFDTIRFLDRRSELRTDMEWLDREAAKSSSRFMILVDLKPAIHSDQERTKARIRWFPRQEIDELGLREHEFIFLGLDDQARAHYLIALSEHRARHVPDGPFALKPLVELRSLANQGVMSAEDLSLIAEARSLAAWHISHRCCGHCGGVTHIKDGGWRRRCWACGQQQYPQMDPVVIMLVHHDDKCLLACHKRFKDNFYSTLAGYLEPGEDIETAVKREVLEEVGLETTNVTYRGSQPWPYPHSLMIGCTAEAKSTDIKPAADEISDAIWVTRQELGKLLESGEEGALELPGDYSIANRLMRDFAA